MGFVPQALDEFPTEPDALPAARQQLSQMLIKEP